MGLDDLFERYKDLPFPEGHDAVTAPVTNAPQADDPVSSPVGESITIEEKFALRHATLAHAHYLSETGNPWYATFDMIRWKEIDSLIKKIITRKIRKRELRSGRIIIMDIEAETEGPDALIIGRHTLMLEGYLNVYNNGKWQFHGHLKSMKGFDTYNFNPSNRRFPAEALVAAARFEGWVLGSRPFNIFISGKIDKKLDGP